MKRCAVRATVVALLILTLAPIFSCRERAKLLCSVWLVREERSSADHWIRREWASFSIDEDGQLVLLEDAICRTRNQGELYVSVLSRVLLDHESFTVLFSEDDSSAEVGEVICTVLLHSGTFRYRIANNGESLIINDGRSDTVWRRWAEWCEPRGDPRLRQPGQ
jgi:hypothetical protein